MKKNPNDKMVTFTIKINGLRTRVVLGYTENIKRLLKYLTAKEKTFKYKAMTRRDLVNYGRTMDERRRAKAWVRKTIPITQNQWYNGGPVL